MITTNWRIERKPLAELTPAPYNPRRALTPKDPAYRKLKRSLKQFGLVQPLVWNQRTGHVVGGHQRLQILSELGHKEVDVTVVDLDDAEEKALNVVLNNREAQSDWDLRRLQTLLEELAHERMAKLTATGFDARHLEQLRERFAPTALPELEPAGLPSAFEVILTIPADRLEAFRAVLDPLLVEHEVECHVKMR